VEIPKVQGALRSKTIPSINPRTRTVIFPLVALKYIITGSRKLGTVSQIPSPAEKKYWKYTIKMEIIISLLIEINREWTRMNANQFNLENIGDN
jgi:hypothetical protein